MGLKCAREGVHFGHTPSRAHSKLRTIFEGGLLQEV